MFLLESLEKKAGALLVRQIMDQRFKFGVAGWHVCILQVPGFEFRVSSSELTANPKLGTRNCSSDVEIHRELQRMRTHSHRSDFLLAFVRNPSLDQLRTKHIALQQEVVVSL